MTMDRETYRHVATRTDGTRVCLVDTLDLYANHSAVPMLHSDDRMDGTVDVRIVHEAMLRALLGRLAPDEASWRVVLLLLWQTLLEKVRPLRILWAGGRAHAWETELFATLQTFHEDTRCWRLNGPRTENCSNISHGGADVRMDWSDLLLPVQTMDVLLIEDDDVRVPLTSAEALLRTVKPWGTVLTVSQDDSWRVALAACGMTEAYQAGDRIITHTELAPAAAAALHAATPAGRAEALGASVGERLALAAMLMDAPLSRTDAETLCVTARDVEQRIVLLFPALHSVTIKQHANEWKRALVAYVLGHGTWEAVQASFRAFADDAAAEKILCVEKKE